MMTRFAHIADCHVGSWRDPFLKELNTKVFKNLIEDIINKNSEKKISFILISGDLFNSALPSIDALKTVTESLKKIKDKGINIYGIPGSHDYSASGKSMLGVLEKAGLFKNVMEFMEDTSKLEFTYDPSGIKITGMHGKKGGLEKERYKELNYDHLEKEEGEKIFVFHTGINEYMPDDMKQADSLPVSFLPKNFRYYAGGHIHYRLNKNIGKSKIAYPGPVFPNNFKELKELKSGSYFITDIENEEIKTQLIELEIPSIKHLKFNADNKESVMLRKEIETKVQEEDLNNKIAMLEITGKLDNGNISDLQLERIKKEIMDSGSLCFIKNTFKLNIPEFKSEIHDMSDINNLEEEIIDKKIEDSDIDKKLGDLSKENHKNILKHLFNIFEDEKNESENKTDFEKRVIDEFGNYIKNEFK
ncbi:MAG: DNA repair exonuclease [Nanobdellota archaeon]